jgi:predicted DNA-binding transcriptional regulator YafY
VAAEAVARHHIKLPPLDFSSIDLVACRAALKARQEAEQKAQQQQMINVPNKEEGADNPHVGDLGGMLSKHVVQGCTWGLR